MRSSIGLLFVVSMLPGCSLVLGLDQLQGGDAGAHDASTDAMADGGSRDAAADARDAAHDAALDAPPLPDGNVGDASLPDAFSLDAFVVDDTGLDGGNDAGSDAGNDAGNDAALSIVGVSGTIVGLPAGSSITLQNGTDMQSISGGTTSFRFDVARGAAYSVSIASAPSTLLCLIYRGSGTASADVTNLFVGCSTAQDLVSYFPFDGDMHATRGSDWTSTSGSIPYVTDRAGQAAHALAAASTGFDYRLTRALNGDATTQPANSTEFTVTLWALLPSTVSATTGEGLFGHFSAAANSVDAQIQWHGGLPYFELYFYWDGGFSQATTTSTTALDRDHWHQIAISATGPSTGPTTFFVRNVYTDGVHEGTTSTCCGWGNFTTWWQLDASRAQRDDVRLYSRMLTDAEIAGIYAAEHVP